MARSDWCALITEPAAEYTAFTELRRFGLRPYVPELCRRWLSPHGGGALPRRYPLFSRYVLLPIGEADHRAVRHCRGLRKVRPILGDDLDGLMLAEHSGQFDEVIVVGDKVKLASGVLASVAARMSGSPGIKVELLLPLFGGVKATVASSQLVRV